MTQDENARLKHRIDVLERNVEFLQEQVNRLNVKNGQPEQQLSKPAR